MVDPTSKADAVRRRKISAPAGNQNPIPSRTASSLVTILTELSWFLFRLLCNVRKLSLVKTMRIPEDRKIIYRPKKAKIFSRQLIRFKLPDWGPYRSTAMAHLPELAQCLDSHPRNLLSLMKLPAVIYQKMCFCAEPARRGWPQTKHQIPLTLLSVLF